MHPTRKEVSPWIAVVGILLTLTVIQIIYWRGLMTRPMVVTGPPKGGGGGAGGPEAPVGQPGVTVATVAGQPQAGYRDGPAQEALFNGPAGVAAGPNGAIYVADSRNHRIREITPDGKVITLAGGMVSGELGGFADGVRSQALFSGPAAVAVAPDGSLLVADTGNHRIRRISPTGVVSSYAGADTDRDDLGRPTGGYRDGSAAQAQFRYPVGLAVDRTGVVYVADAGNHRVRRISPAGEVTTLAAVGQERMEAPTEVCLGPGEQLWVADTAQGALWVGPRDGPLQRWQAPRGEKAPKGPAGLAAVRDQLYLVDTREHCLLRLAGGRLSLVAGQQGSDAPGYADGYGNLSHFFFPGGLALGPRGELYIADFGNNCVRRVTVDEKVQEGR